MNPELSRVNVILIDRIVDMYAVTDFASSCLLDKMSMLLNRFPKTCSDIAVTTEPLIQDSKYVIYKIIILKCIVLSMIVYVLANKFKKNIFI